MSGKLKSWKDGSRVDAQAFADAFEKQNNPIKHFVFFSHYGIPETNRAHENLFKVRSVCVEN